MFSCNISNVFYHFTNIKQGYNTKKYCWKEKVINEHEGMCKNHILHKIDDILIFFEKISFFHSRRVRIIFVHILAILLIFCGAESMSAPYENSIFNI